MSFWSAHCGADEENGGDIWALGTAGPFEPSEEEVQDLLDEYFEIVEGMKSCENLQLYCSAIRCLWGR